MKLDYNCVRNILLTVESLKYGEKLCVENYKSFDLLKDYTKEQMEYTISRLNESGYVPKTSVTEVIGGVVYGIDALTWEGHQYLDCIRDKNIWEKVLSKVSEVSVPVSLIGELAINFLRLKYGLQN